MYNEPLQANPAKLKLVSMIVAAVLVAVVAIGGVWSLVKNAVAEPARVDYLHLDNQRNVANISLEAYDPIVEDFTSHYNTAYKEGFLADERADIKAGYDKQFNDEVNITERRLQAMDRSIALKDESVQTAYRNYTRDYRHMVDYIKLSKATATQVVEAISGVCSKVTKISASGDYAKRFVGESQVCMDKLAESKKHVTPSAQVMMTSLQKMYKDRRDAFKKAVDEKNKTLRVALSSAALLGLLNINGELAQIQKDYSATETKASESAEAAVTKSSDALHRALQQAANQAKAKKE